MRVWIYRPDRELEARKINKDFCYNCNNKSYWDCFDEEKERRQAYLELLKKKRKEVGNISVSVPYE
jgi:hypothetical protein